MKIPENIKKEIEAILPNVYELTKYKREDWKKVLSWTNGEKIIYNGTEAFLGSVPCIIITFDNGKITHRHPVGKAGNAYKEIEMYVNRGHHFTHFACIPVEDPEYKSLYEDLYLHKILRDIEKAVVEKFKTICDIKTANDFVTNYLGYFKGKKVCRIASIYTKTPRMRIDFLIGKKEMNYIHCEEEIDIVYTAFKNKIKEISDDYE